MSNIKRVCVFCASSSKVSQVYIGEAEKLGRQLADSNIAMNYGGGAVGLMGAIANEMLKHGGAVRGVIPTFMVAVEWEHKGVQDMVHVATMAERKQLLVKDVDAVIALPGSTGTLEELLEVLSNKKLGLFQKPVILLNTNGFFDPMLMMFQKMAEENFMRYEHLELFQVIDMAKEVIPAIEKAPLWDDNAIKMASI